MGTENCSIVKCHGQENNFKYLNIYIYLERIISRLKTILKIRLCRVILAYLFEVLQAGTT